MSGVGGSNTRTRLSNLPLPLNRFIGREHEIPTIDRLLRDARLVTLAGAGGIGKSRLALEVAERVRARYTDGVMLVELAALSDPLLVPHAIAAALGVGEAHDLQPVETLIEALRTRSVLLILDNC